MMFLRIAKPKIMLFSGLALFFVLHPAWAALKIAKAPAKTIAPVVIQGKILNQKTNLGIEGASLWLYDSKSTLLTSTKTDVSGSYKITYSLAKQGRLTLKVEATNFKTLSQSSIVLPGKDYTLNLKLIPINQAPQAISVAPVNVVSRPNQAITLNTTFSDANGYQDIQYAFLLINTSTSSKNCFSAGYLRTTNKLYLRNDKNTGWLGGYSPGTGKIIENSYCKLDCAKTSVLTSGNTLNISWNIIFKPTFLGAKNTYISVTDNSNASSGWQNKANWVILGPPKIISTIPANYSIIDAPDNFLISPVISDTDQGSLEYQYSVDKDIKQGWSKQASYNWAIAEKDTREVYTLKFEVRNQAGSDSKEILVFIAYKPPLPIN